MVDSEVVSGESKSRGSRDFDLSDFPPLPVANGNVAGVGAFTVVNGCDVGAGTLSVANGKVDVVNGGSAEAGATGNQASGLGTVFYWNFFDPSLKCFPPVDKNGHNVIKPPKTMLVDGAKQWDNTLWGNFLGKSPTFWVFHKTDDKLWVREGSVEIRFLAINFPSKRVRDWVLESGPWHIQQLAIILRRWLPDMISKVLNLHKALVWIKLWHVPLELFSQTGLGYLASDIGRAIYTDKATTLKQQLEFAKICVEVEAKSSLCSSVSVELDEDNCIEVGVELVWAPPCCDHCCIFGHSGDKCTKNVVGTEVVSDDYVVCDVLKSLKVPVEFEIAVEAGVDENLVSSGTVVESEVNAADGSKPVETDMVKEGVDPLESVNGKEILVTPNRFDILDIVNHGEENCISPKKERIVAVGVVELMNQLKPKAKGQGKKNKGGKQGSKKKGVTSLSNL
ncbi:hypothetical protein V6N13_135224 [Hibiscus sabdariffa]